MKIRNLLLRGDIFYYRRIVPIRFRASTKKREVVFSLKTNNQNTAIQKCATFNEFYDNIFATDSLSQTELELSYQSICDAAVKIGISYKPIEFSNEKSVSEIVDALEPNIRAYGALYKTNKSIIAAVAGAVQPDLSAKVALDRYTELTDELWFGLNERELQKKLNPLRETVKYFAFVMKNPDLLKFKRSDAMKFKDCLLSRVKNCEINVFTANRKIMHLRKIVRKVFDADYPDLKNPFDRVKIDLDVAKNKRPPFSSGEMNKVVAQLDASNADPQLKAIIFIAIYTGATCKEICLLQEADIQLDCDIPFIRIQPNELRHKVKSGGSRHRDIPLICDALSAVKKYPNGFPKYARTNGAEAFSAAANKLLSKVTDKTMYSFRHRFADLLRNSQCPERLADALMGHTSQGMGSYYGNGYTLQNKLDAITNAFAE